MDNKKCNCNSCETNQHIDPKYTVDCKLSKEYYDMLAANPGSTITIQSVGTLENPMLKIVDASPKCHAPEGFGECSSHQQSEAQQDFERDTKDIVRRASDMSGSIQNLIAEGDYFIDDDLINIGRDLDLPAPVRMVYTVSRANNALIASDLANEMGDFLHNQVDMFTNQYRHQLATAFEYISQQVAVAGSVVMREMCSIVDDMD